MASPTPALQVYLSAELIQQRIQSLGREIAADYPDSAQPLVLICILKGACIFLADLVRALDRPTRLDFMGISSYGKGKTTSGEVKVTKDLDVSIEGLDVLVVEDIVDSGVTLNYLTHVLKQRKPKSINIVTLLDKPERRMRDVKVKYVGFQIRDEFVVGYGLDYAEEYRNLKEVCILGS